jgi:beta-glucosidase
MIRSFILVSIAGIIAVLLSSCGDRISEDSIDTLLKSMTLEEKVGQMIQITLDVVTRGEDILSSYEPVELDDSLLRDAVLEYGIGSIINTANNRALTFSEWHSIINRIDSISRFGSRIAIPVIYGIDAIHGATYTAEAVMFPQQIGMAATWNPKLAEELASMAAYEKRLSGITWNFSPVADLGMDPRWPRQWETFGEDPFLASVMVVSYVIGYEGGSSVYGNDTGTISCLKHFLGYGLPFSGKDRTPALIPEIELRERHLPPFEAGIKAGASSIMLNSGIINGVPVHSDKSIITDLLKNELGFKGLVLSDWGDIEYLYKRDRIVPNIREAIKISINAGLDMVMLPYHYQEFHKTLISLVNDGEVPVSRIDDAVRRILRLKIQSGLMDKPVLRKERTEYNLRTDYEKTAYTAASESVTLLKNENLILPLKKATRILVSGPNANSMRTLNGGWSYSWQGEKTEEFTREYNTIYGAIANRFGSKNVSLIEGVSYDFDSVYYEEYNSGISRAVAKAADVDVILLCLGENSYTEKPGDLNDLNISALQQQLARELLATGKPVILVLNQGRPRLITSFHEGLKAILHSYLPGNYGGDAIADILIGKVNPSGKLPYSYPKYPNALITYYHKPSESASQTLGVYNYAGRSEPLYQFGFGLSYTTFSYDQLDINRDTLYANDSLQVSVVVTNTGEMTGKEVVQLYSSAHYSTVTPDVKRLRAFEKIEIMPGEMKRVTFTLTPHDLSFINRKLERTTESGNYTIQIGDLTRIVHIADDVVFK